MKRSYCSSVENYGYASTSSDKANISDKPTGGRHKKRQSL